MRISRKIWVPTAVVAALVAGCGLNRDAIFPSLVLQSEPQIFCPAEPVRVSWDVSNMPRRLGYCNALGADYRRPIACDTSLDCPGGLGEGVCLDGICCPSSVYTGNSAACPTATGCLPPFELVVASDTIELTPAVNPETVRVRGTRVVMPESTTVFSASLAYEGGREVSSATSQMVAPDGATRRAVSFPFACDGATPTWIRANMEEPLVAGEGVRVASVRNTTTNIIVLSTTTPERPSVTLNPGETTEALNGVLLGQWIAALSPLDRASLTRPRCEASNVADPWPDLSIELQLECVRD